MGTSIKHIFLALWLVFFSLKKEYVIENGDCGEQETWERIQKASMEKVNKNVAQMS